MKMRKIVAIVAAVLMLFSVIPFSAMAADSTATITFDNTSKRTSFDTSKQVWEENGITVTNNKSASTSNVANYSKPARFYASSNLIVEYEGGNITQIVFDCNSGSYATTLKNSIGTTATTSVSSDKVTVTFAEPVESFTIAKLAGQVRMDGLTVTYSTGAANPDCDHDSLVCGDTCEACGETKEHVYDNNCDADCANGCGITNPNYADHVYDGDYDVNCNVCGGEREVNFPEADSTLTIVEANTIGGGMTHNTYTPSKYYVTGVVESISNTTYGNMYIVDEEGNKLSIYGSYSADGKTQFGSMTEKPVVGMTITVYGVIGYYSTAAQMKNVWITEMISNCEHVWDNDCDTTCDDCGFTREIEHDYVADIVESTCTEAGHASYECSVCFHSYDEELPLAAHNYVNDICSACGAQKPNGYAPITSADQLVSGQYVMVVETGYAPTYINDITASSPWLLCGQPEIVDGIIADPTGFLFTVTVDGTTVKIQDANGNYIAPKGTDTNGIKVAEYAWDWTFEDGKFIFAGTAEKVYLASNTVASQGDNKFRGYKQGTCTGTSGASYKYKFTLYAASTSTQPDEPECAHQWSEATCTEPATCALCGAVDGQALGHDWEIISQEEATCTAGGSIVYECAACGEDKSEVFPALPHTYVDGICSGCGAELPLEATITFGEDKAQRTEFTTELQKWEHDGLVLINNKAASTTNIGDYAGRCYKDSEIVISFPGMTSLVIDATGMETKYLWDDTLTNAGLTFTVEEKIYTITFAEPTDSITLTAANQVRANKITATRVVPCAHEYDNACDVDCNLCYETREVTHNSVHVEAKAPTCAEMGNIEYWYCDVCGMAWLDEACTQNTNLKAVKLSATGEHTYDDEYDADCNVCGDIRDVPEKPVVEIFYGDVDGDGEITTMDGVVLDQYLSGWEVDGMNTDNADVDGDGEITTMDGVVLDQYLSGWDVVLGPEEAKIFNDGELQGW